MLVPAAVEDLHEPDVALGQPAGQQAQRANVPGLCTSGPYMSRMCFGSFEMSVSSGTEVCIRKAISYWAIRAWVSGSAIDSYSLLVQPVDRVEHAPAGAGVDARRGSRGTAPDRPSTAAPRPGACWAGSPSPRAGCRSPGRCLAVGPGRGHHHERRQVLVHRAQAVAEPGAQAGPAREAGCPVQM